MSNLPTVHMKQSNHLVPQVVPVLDMEVAVLHIPVATVEHCPGMVAGKAPAEVVVDRPDKEDSLVDMAPVVAEQRTVVVAAVDNLEVGNWLAVPLLEPGSRRLLVLDSRFLLLGPGSRHLPQEPDSHFLRLERDNRFPQLERDNCSRPLAMDNLPRLQATDKLILPELLLASRLPFSQVLLVNFSCR
jgi:hypothetical protein